MTDPLDTNALRDLQALSGGILSRNLLEGSGAWKINRDVTRALGTAADEVDRLRESRDTWKRLANDERDVTDRLRAVIENAPHDSGCQFSFLSDDKPRRCTCWKAEVL